MEDKARAWKALCLLIVAVLFLFPANLASAVSTISPSLTIAGVPASATLAYDSGQNEIFAQYADIQHNAIMAVVSLKTNGVTTTISEGYAGGSPGAYFGDVVYDSKRGLIFAAFGSAKGSDTSTPSIAVISDSNNTLVAMITYATFGNSAYNWPYHPVGMAYDAGKNEILVSDQSAGSVYVISDSSYAVVATIGLVPNAGEMVYDPARGEVFVANSNRISAIDDTANAVAANISVSATSLAVDPVGGKVFAYNGTAISVISDNTYNVVQTITGITQGSTSIAYDPVKNEVFAGAVVSIGSGTIAAQLPSGIGNIVYNSGVGEIIGAASTGLELFPDSAVTTTSTTATTSSTTTTSQSSSTTTTSKSTTSTSSSSGGGGGVPEFPYQLIAAVAFTALLVASYLAVRSRTTQGHRKSAGSAT